MMAIQVGQTWCFRNQEQLDWLIKGIKELGIKFTNHSDFDWYMEYYKHKKMPCFDILEYSLDWCYKEYYLQEGKEVLEVENHFNKSELEILKERLAKSEAKHKKATKLIEQLKTNGLTDKQKQEIEYAAVRSVEIRYEEFMEKDSNEIKHLRSLMDSAKDKNNKLIAIKEENEKSLLALAESQRFYKKLVTKHSDTIDSLRGTVKMYEERFIEDKYTVDDLPF